MKTAAETEAALTGTFLNKSFGESFFVIWGKWKCAKKQNISTKMILVLKADFTTAFGSV